MDARGALSAMKGKPKNEVDKFEQRLADFERQQLRRETAEFRARQEADGLAPKKNLLDNHIDAKTVTLNDGRTRQTVYMVPCMTTKSFAAVFLTLDDARKASGWARELPRAECEQEWAFRRLPCSRCLPPTMCVYGCLSVSFCFQLFLSL